MANLTRKQWPKGWIPSQDYQNGSPLGLLRMDNLYLDEDGVLSIVRGTQKVNSGAFAGFVHTCYSTYVYASKFRYVGIGTGEIARGDSSSFTTIASGGSSSEAAFAESLGQVLCCSGSARKRDNGTVTYEITPIAPTGPPGIDTSNQPITDIGGPTWGTWSAVTPSSVTNGIDYVSIDTDTTAANPELFAIAKVLQH